MNQICSAQCSIAELYLTDLCFEDDAEARCQAALDEALAMDQGSPEVTQSLANLRLSQQKGEEAAVLMLETYRRLKACYQEDEEEEEETEMEEDDEEGAAGNSKDGNRVQGIVMPSVMFRIQSAKLLLECQAYNKKCARKAVHILEQCKCEEDDNVEIWYLLGVAYFTKGVPDLETAKGHLMYAQEMLSKLQKTYRNKDEFPYLDHIRLVEEQLALVKEAQEKGVGTGKCGVEEEDEEDSSSEEEEGDEEEEDGKMEN